MSPPASDDRANRIRQLVHELLEDGEANESDLLAAHPDLMPELSEQLRLVCSIQSHPHA